MLSIVIQATKRSDHDLKGVESLTTLGYKCFLSKAPLSDPRPIAPCVCIDVVFCLDLVSEHHNLLREFCDGNHG